MGEVDELRAAESSVLSFCRILGLLYTKKSTSLNVAAVVSNAAPVTVVTSS